MEKFKCTLWEKGGYWFLDTPWGKIDMGDSVNDYINNAKKEDKKNG